MEKQFQPTQIYSDDPTSHKGELFSYQFIIGREDNGEIGTIESVFVSNEYRDDPEIQKVVNGYIKEAGIEPAAQRAFVTFGIDTNITKKKPSPAIEALTKVIDDAKYLIDALTENK